MKFGFNQQTLQSALKKKDLALWSCLGLVVINSILVFKILNTEEKWVLIPHYDTGHRVGVTFDRYSDEYFMDWASSVVGILLCVNPDSVEWRNQQILKISTESYGNLKETLQEGAQKIKQDQVSTVFYPKKFKVHQKTQTIDVIGQHISYFGKDSEPVSHEKTFRLNWVVRPHGIILLSAFRELTQEELKNEKK